MAISGDLSRETATFADEIALHDLVDQFLLVLVAVRHLLGGHHVEDHTAAPHVPGEGEFAVEAFGRHVYEGAQQILVGAVLVLDKVHRDAEVNDLDLHLVEVVGLHLLDDDYVLKLEITVQNVHFVHVGDGAEDLRDDFAGDGAGKGVAVGELEQVATLAELGDHVEVVIVLVDVVEFDDVGVVQPFQYFELVDETQLLLNVHIFLLNLLHCPHFLDVLLVGLINAPEPSLPDFVLDLVVLAYRCFLHHDEVLGVNLDHLERRFLHLHLREHLEDRREQQFVDLGGQLRVKEVQGLGSLLRFAGRRFAVEVGLVDHDVLGGSYHLRKLPIYLLLQASRGSLIIIQILKRNIRLLGFSLLKLL